MATLLNENPAKQSETLYPQLCISFFFIFVRCFSVYLFSLNESRRINLDFQDFSCCIYIWRRSDTDAVMPYKYQLTLTVLPDMNILKRNQTYCDLYHFKIPCAVHIFLSE